MHLLTFCCSSISRTAFPIAFGLLFIGIGLFKKDIRLNGGKLGRPIETPWKRLLFRLALVGMGLVLVALTIGFEFGR
jgi:hypothetical protein